MKIFKEKSIKQGMIIIYAMMDRYEDAIRLALETDRYDLAKSYASLPEDEKQKKRLWLTIVKTMIEHN